MQNKDEIILCYHKVTVHGKFSVDAANVMILILLTNKPITNLVKPKKDGTLFLGILQGARFSYRGCNYPASECRKKSTTTVDHIFYKRCYLKSEKFTRTNTND
jgi:hypothetical protein